MKISNKGFTLVELIVVITILAVLATIGFLSFQGYSAISRDSVRLSDIKNIQKGFNLKLTKGEKLPVPDNKIDINASGSLINYQGFAGTGTLGFIGVHGDAKDPLDNTFYTYSTNRNRDKYQLLTFFEKQDITFTIENTFANLNERFPKVVGDNLGIILNSENLKSIDYNLDILHTTNNDLIYLNGTEKIKFTDDNKKYLAFPNKSCKSILESGNGNTDGVYTIKYKEFTLNVYCDMTSVGGGWTLFYANNGNSDSTIKKSYTTMRNEVVGKDNFLYDLSDYNKENLAGVLDYSIFTKDGAHELLITNRDYFKTQNKWLHTIFDTGDSLQWSIGNDILGSSYPEKGHCIEIPNEGTMSLIYYTGSESLNNRFILNQWGQVIGVSSETHNCNGYTDDIFRYAMFYTATGNGDDFRTRYSGGVGGNWRIDNQYRYFIR